MFFEAGQNFLGIVAGIDDDGFTSLLISQNRAVALKPAYRECFMIIEPIVLPELSAFPRLHCPGS